MRTLEPARPPRTPASPRPLRLRAAVVVLAFVVLAAGVAACGSASGGTAADPGKRSPDVPYWYLTCVDFVDEDHGWAVGGVGGVLVRTGVAFATHDGGETWQPQEMPLHLALRGVDMLTPRLGFAVGCDGSIMRCTDGRRWCEVDSGTTNSLYAVEFLDERTGWAVGDGVLLRTTDGGDTWQARPHPAPGVQFTDISFGDTRHGWAVGGSIVSHGNWGATVLTTADGGQTWDELDVPTVQALYAVQFIDDHEGWIVGNHGVVLHTTSGGAVWEVQRQARDDGPGFLRGVTFVDRRHGWALGGRGRASRIPVILQTRDGGRRWHRVALSEETFFCWVTALSRGHVWVVGNDYRLVRSTDWDDWSGSQVAPTPHAAGRAPAGPRLQKLMGAAHILL